MGFWKTIARLWRTAQHYTPADAVAPPITHKVETKWTDVSHNEPLRKTCGFLPPTPEYAPCTRPPHAPWEPCDFAAVVLDEGAYFVPQSFSDDITKFATDDALAQRLHREYRAASKALNGNAKHDHGWKGCHAKRYFWNRARQWRRENEQRRLKDNRGEYIIQ